MPEKTRAQLRQEAQALQQRLTELERQLARSEEQTRHLQGEQAHAARLTAAGEVALSFVHEFQQPLAAITAYTEACQQLARAASPDRKELLRCLGAIALQASHAAALVQRLRRFVKPGESAREPTALNDVIAEAVLLAEPQLRRNQVRLELKLAEGLPTVVADRVQIEQVLLNLLRNGAEAMSGTPVEERLLTVSTSTAGEPPEVQAAVADNGPGLRVEVVQKLFEPFASTKPEGLGVGLALSRSILQAHGGRLWVKPNPERGTTFFFALPASPGTADRGPRPVRRRR